MLVSKLTDVLKARSGVCASARARVQRQDVLEPEHDVADDDGEERHQQDRDRIALPALLDGLVDAADAVDAALDRPQDRAQDGPLALHDLGDVAAQDRRDEQDGRREDDQGDEIVGGHAQKSSGRNMAQSR